jgi:hypothetical protein
MFGVILYRKRKSTGFIIGTNLGDMISSYMVMTDEESSRVPQDESIGSASIELVKVVKKKKSSDEGLGKAVKKLEKKKESMKLITTQLKSNPDIEGPSPMLIRRIKRMKSTTVFPEVNFNI